MQRTAITVGRARDEVTRLWAARGERREQFDRQGTSVTFNDAPGDRGTEIHVELGGHGAHRARRARRKANRPAASSSSAPRSP